MSKRHDFIEVTPPDLTAYASPVEVITSDGHVCPRCHGEGWHWGVDEASLAPEKKRCRFCEGTGTLQAVIRVHWGPDYINGKIPDDTINL